MKKQFLSVQKIIIIIAVFLLTIIALSGFTYNSNIALANDESALDHSIMEIEPILYSMPDRRNYATWEFPPTDKTEIGTTMGKMYVNASSFTPINNYNDIAKTYAVRGTVSFTYKLNRSNFNVHLGNGYWLSNEGDKGADGYKFNHPVAKGTILVVDRTNDSKHVKLDDRHFDIFNKPWQNDEIEFYTFSTNDLMSVKKIRISIIYEIHNDREWRNIIEQYNVNLGLKPDFALHNISSSSSSLPIIEGIDSSIISKAETLVNDSATLSGFSIDTWGREQNCKVFYQFNDGLAFPAENGQVFKDPGKYTIYAISNIFPSNENGIPEKKDVYILPEINKLKELLLDPIFQRNEKYYNKDSKIPSYTNFYNDFILNIEASDTMEIQMPPNICYTLLTPNNESLKLEENTELASGTYTLCLNIGNDQSGDIVKLQSNFVVSDFESKPSINYQNLNKIGLAAEHYEVALQTSGGGYYIFCFAKNRYAQAKELAWQIEENAIELHDNIKYYRSAENANIKTPYKNEILLQDTMRAYVDKNVVLKFFDASDPMSKTTIESDSIKNLQERSTKESLHIFSNEIERDYCRSTQCFIDEEFKLIKVAEFESNQAYYYSVSNPDQHIDIIYDVPLIQQIPADKSDVYHIVEMDIYNHKTEYDYVYIPKIQAANPIVIDLISEESYSKLDFSNNNEEIEAINYVEISLNKENKLTYNSLIKFVSDEDDMSNQVITLLSGTNKFLIEQSGRVSIVDSTGNVFSFHINISKKVEEVKPDINKPAEPNIPPHSSDNNPTQKQDPESNVGNGNNNAGGGNSSSGGLQSSGNDSGSKHYKDSYTNTIQDNNGLPLWLIILLGCIGGLVLLIIVAIIIWRLFFR